MAKSYIDKIKELCPELDEVEIGAIDKYISNQTLASYEDEVLTDLNIKNIKKQKKKISDFDINNIETYISFFSLAPVEKYEYSLFDKNFEIFKNIKNVYFLATPQSIEGCEEEKNKIEEKHTDITVNIISIDSNNYDNAYSKLFLELESFDKSKILIDNTLGPRIIGYNLYKFSIDQGTKLITWQSNQIKGFSKRIPGTDTLNYIEFPQLKNSTIINNINKLLIEYKFMEASTLAKSINNLEEAYLYKELGDIFSINSIFDYQIFYGKLNSFYDNFNIKNLNPSLEKKLFSLKEELKTYLESDKKTKEIIYISIMFDFYKKNLNLVEILEDNVLELIFSTMNFSQETEKKKIRSFLDKNIEELEAEFEDNFYNPDEMDLFTLLCNMTCKKTTLKLPQKENIIFKYLQYSIPKNLYLKDNILYLNKYGIEIDLNKEIEKYPKDEASKKLKNLSSGSVGIKKILRELLNSISNEIYDCNFKELIDANNKTKTNLNTTISRLRDDFSEINSFIYKIIKENYPTKSIYFENNDLIIFNRIIKEQILTKVPKTDLEKFAEKVLVQDEEILKRKRSYKQIVKVIDEFILKINPLHF